MSQKAICDVLVTHHQSKDGQAVLRRHPHRACWERKSCKNNFLGCVRGSIAVVLGFSHDLNEGVGGSGGSQGDEWLYPKQAGWHAVPILPFL